MIYSSFKYALSMKAYVNGLQSLLKLSFFSAKLEAFSTRANDLTRF